MMFVDLKWGGLAVLALACTLARAADDAVTYEAFGAAGDGKTDDQAAIVRAHAEANRRNVPVRAGNGKTYYIGPGTAVATVTSAPRSSSSTTRASPLRSAAAPSSTSPPVQRPSPSKA